jgi:hypothetical protein
LSATHLRHVACGIGKSANSYRWCGSTPWARATFFPAIRSDGSVVPPGWRCDSPPSSPAFHSRAPNPPFPTQFLH